MDKNALQQMIDVLRAERSSDQEISDFLAKLSEDVAQVLYLDAFSSFSDEDLEAIKKAPSIEEKNKEIRARYTRLLGKDPGEKSKEVYHALAQKFLDEYQKQKSI
jgi:hypothetical protein